MERSPPAWELAELMCENDHTIESNAQIPHTPHKNDIITELRKMTIHMRWKRQQVAKAILRKTAMLAQHNTQPLATL